MPPSLKAEHRKQLSFLAKQTSQVLQDFCKLAVDYLQKGPNLKLYVAAAQRLQVEPEVIRSSVEALINLLIESSEHRLSDENFRELIVSLGFRDLNDNALMKFHEIMRSEIDRSVSKMGLRLPHYHDMEWRFQVQLASRSSLGQSTPIFTLDLMLKSDENSRDVEHVLLQSDTTNIVRLAQELESAMADCRTQHIRGIRRSVK